MIKECRVVVSGIGVVAPNGIGLDAFWRSLLAGESGIDRISLFDTADFPIRVAGEISGFCMEDFVDRSFRASRLSRHTQLALAAMVMALEDAGLNVASLQQHAPVPIVVGVSTGGVDLLERAKEELMRRGPKKVTPYLLVAYQPHAIASALADLLKIEARTLTVSSACAAGLDALGQAYEIVRRGKADLVIAGGSDCPITPVTVAALSAAGLVPSLNGEDPRTVSRPFDRDRKGGIMAEGSGVLIVERLESAEARGAFPYLEICGFGSSVDRETDDPAEGLGVSMCHALGNAGCHPDEVEYVCAHGPSDLVIDRVETRMIKDVLGKHAYQIPVTSIKGATGNPLSAAGPHEVSTCAKIFQKGVVPPTVNLKVPATGCDLDYVMDGPRRIDVATALVNLHGLGGGNSSMVVRKVT